MRTNEIGDHILAGVPSAAVSIAVGRQQISLHFHIGRGKGDMQVSRIRLNGHVLAADLSRRLAELLGPEPRTFDHNVMAEVREELKRRGLTREFGREVEKRLHYVYLPEQYFELIDAPLAVQIAAAVEVLEETGKK